MPRDANGNYTLPTGNPVVTQTDISSVWANDTMSDIGTEMTDSLSRSGKGGMTGPFPIVDKQGSVPGLSFAAEPTSGLKREAAGDVQMQVQGTSKMRWTAAGDAEVWRNSTWNPVAIDPADRKVMYGEGGVTTIFHYGDTAAPGWMVTEPDANLRNLVIGPAAGGGVISGTDDPTNLSSSVSISISISGSTGSTTIAHTHGTAGINVSGPDSTTGVSSPGAAGVATASHSHTLSGATADSGTQTAHNHSFSGSDSGGDTVSFAPRYARGLLMQLDA